MLKSNKIFLGLILLLALSACNFPSSQDAGSVQTAAAETVSAQLTLNAQLTPSSTPTPTDTPTPEPTNTPAATNTPAPTATAKSTCDAIIFVSDVTVPDGTEFTAGATFTKTWRLRNAGTCTWTVDYDVVFDTGAAMGGPAAQALTGSVAPGQEVDISVELTAPAEPGTYRGNWKLRNASGVVFGLPGPFYVEISVKAASGGSSGGSGSSGDITVTLVPVDNGSVRSNGTINANPNTGDTDSNAGSQAFVSFDISGIPAGSTIKTVRVDFSDYDTLSQPFSSLGCLRAYQGTFFPLDASDYFSGSPLGALLRWCDTTELSSNFLDDDVKAALQSALGASRFELRLQFNEKQTDNDGTADMVRFGDVELIVTYTKP